MTDSTESATPSKSTAWENSDFSVQIQIEIQIEVFHLYFHSEIPRNPSFWIL